MSSEIDLKQQIEEQEAPGRKKFGTFSGVFIPTLLTILGVIMYLREGSVVGNAGLLGAWLIIGISFAITGFTGLSMSSIVTNIRVGAGGAYSMISQSLGLEIGGSIAIPLYLSQALAVSMYIFGFRAGWSYIFPNHPALLVDLVAFGAIFTIAYISAGLAFRVQYIIMAIIAGSLISIVIAAVTGSMQHPVTWTGGYPGFPENGFQGTNFWEVFAVFFPAATGIMAGANISGDLENPRRSIPVGTMSAIGLSLVIYLGLAYWLVRSAPVDDLVNNYTIMIDRAAWGPIVLAGLLGATFSSALSSTVGAPRILQAIGEHRVLPKGGWFARTTKSGEPRNAMWVTAVIVLGALMLRSLNSVAPLITMFFLITYAMINVVVLIEQSLGLVSFRPLIRIPRIFPFLGAVGCLFAMFIVNPAFSLIAVVIVVGFYGILIRRSLQAPFGDVRSGLFVAVAEWAAKRVSDLPTIQERAWKPNLLVPVERSTDLRGTYRFVHNIAYPKGSVKIMGLTTYSPKDEIDERLSRIAQTYREDGVFSSWAVIESQNYAEGILAGMQAMGGVFFKPNLIFLKLFEDEERQEQLLRIIEKAPEQGLGVLLFSRHPRAGLGRRKLINLWVRDQSPDWRLTMDIGNLDLAILSAYKLIKNWNAELNLISAVKDPQEIGNAEEYLDTLINLARLPYGEVHVENREFEEQVKITPQADLSIFGLPEEPDLDFVRKMTEMTRSSCLFVRDSGNENALA